jgi:hypothetical protein
MVTACDSATIRQLSFIGAAGSATIGEDGCVEATLDPTQVRFFRQLSTLPGGVSG